MTQEKLGRYARQTSIISGRSLLTPITIIGAGGIGSWTTLALAKMGFQNIKVFDFDTVENHNVASQFFSESQLGMKKVDALKASVLEQTGVEIETEEDIEKEEYLTNCLIILAIDSMEERIRLGKIYKDKPIFIIDGRMGGLVAEVHSDYSHDYLSRTVPPDQVDGEPCTAKAISFNCLVIAGLIANQVRLYVKETGDDFHPSITPSSLFFCFETLTLLKK